MSEPTAAVALQALRKVFGTGDQAVTAVAGVDLEVHDGEFFSMLGPSGSGKTTVLRMIAGFELPTSGTILLGGRDVSRLAPFERDVNTVFQDYALFPHMSVEDNVGYGLKVKRVGKDERVTRVAQALATVRLEGYGGRRPSQLSGGQRQRVALARALVNRPRVLLTTFTTAPGLQTLPLWIFDNLFRPNQAPVVNVVAAILVVLSLLPIWAAQKLSGDETGGRL